MQWGTEIRRSDGPIPFLCYEPRRRRVTELLDDAARWSDRVHLVQGERRVRYSDMFVAIDRVAAALHEEGLRAGDRLLLLAGNSPDWVIAWWAGLRLGAVVAPGNRWWSASEITHAIKLTTPTVVVADAKMATLLPHGDKTWRAISIEQVHDWGSRPSAAVLPGVVTDENDPAVIIFTAGTTGAAKAAVLAHRSVIANLHNLLLVSGRLPHQLASDRTGEVILQSGPLFHIGGVQSLLLALLGGNTVVFLDNRFDAGQVLDVIEREQITVWGAVPTMVVRVLEHPTVQGRDLTRVRSISLGGAPVTAELMARLRAAFPAVHRGVSTVYGMTEAGGTVAAASGAMMAAHPHTSGKPLPVVELRIESSGEIVVRTPSQMLGYWGESAPEIIDAEGWLHTGDLGRIEDGLLYLTGRAKDIIIRGGENIAAAHVEEVLHRHPAVAAVAVVGLPHPDLGEIVGAAVQVRSETSEAELAAFAAASLGRFEVPTRWWLSEDPLPMTDAGKVNKRALRKQWISTLEIPS